MLFSTWVPVPPPYFILYNVNITSNTLYSIDERFSRFFSKFQVDNGPNSCIYLLRKNPECKLYVFFLLYR